MTLAIGSHRHDGWEYYHAGEPGQLRHWTINERSGETLDIPFSPVDPMTAADFEAYVRLGFPVCGSAPYISRDLHIRVRRCFGRAALKAVAA